MLQFFCLLANVLYNTLYSIALHYHIQNIDISLNVLVLTGVSQELPWQILQLQLTEALTICFTDNRPWLQRLLQLTGMLSHMLCMVTDVAATIVKSADSCVQKYQTPHTMGLIDVYADFFNLQKYRYNLLVTRYMSKVNTLL